MPSFCVCKSKHESTSCRGVRMKKGKSSKDVGLAYRLERSQRAMMLRKKYLGITRTAMSNKYDIALSTLQSWENTKEGGLVENGALQLLEIYQSEGLGITIEWLMYGVGNPPLELMLLDSTEQKEKLPELHQVTKELQYFYQLSDKATHSIIQDDAFLPWLSIGDYVAGYWLFGDELSQANNHLCIVQLLTGQTMVRILKTGKNGDFILMTSNPSTTVDEPRLVTQIVSAAPIVWMRKLSKLGQF